MNGWSMTKSLSLQKCSYAATPNLGTEILHIIETKSVEDIYQFTMETAIERRLTPLVLESLV
jgi:hypothetical protein